MNGILIINKPQWYTSFDVIAKIRKILGSKKVGHTGTLDPMATGVLVVCVGEATKLVDSLTCEDKIYKTTIKLGVKTDTGDLSGTRDGDNWSPSGTHLSDISKQQFDSNLEYCNSHPQKFDLTLEQIEATLHAFIGRQKQTPPIYSSIKVDGKKLYEYARKGEEVKLPERDIEVYDIYDISYNGKDEITYTVHCSKGTYIRSLNEDIAKKLGVCGTTLVLERLKTGQFEIENAIEIDEVSEEKIISIEKLFENKIELSKTDEKKLLNGIGIEINREDGIYNVYIEQKYIGLGKVKDKKLKRFIIL